MTSASSMVSELSAGSSVMGMPTGGEREPVEQLLEEFSGPRLGSDIQHFHPFAVGGAQSQDPSACKGAWEILSTLEPRSKGNRIIFAKGTHPHWSAGESSEKLCWAAIPKVSSNL